MNNPYPYSLDNKRYQTWNYYGRTHYGHKIAKIPLNAGFTCPNRDGFKAVGGCLFCPVNGADDFPIAPTTDLWDQYLQRCAVYHKKWKDFIPVPYFQAYSNTYASISHLQETFWPFWKDPKAPCLFIATRSDCFDADIYDLLSEMNKTKDIWIELGIQSTYDQITDSLNCHHHYSQAVKVIQKLHSLNIKTSVHLINGLPNETKEMMINNAKEIAKLPIDSIKFHALLLLRNSKLETLYQANPFPLLTREEYLDILIKQLEVINPQTIIERVTSDASETELIAPTWPIKKTITLNQLDKLLLEQHTYQGKYYETTNN